MRGPCSHAPVLVCRYSFRRLDTLKEQAMTELVRVHMRVPGTAPLPELMTLFQRIEAAGFDGAGILDSQCAGTRCDPGQAAATPRG
jgi:hypothetical protein